MGGTWNITAQSVPVLDGWGWADYWQAQDWMQWHQLMVAEYGVEKANYAFLYYYHEAGFLAASYDWRTFNSEFKDYCKQYGMYDGLFKGVGILAKPFSIVLDVGGNIANIVEDTTTGVANTSKLIKYLLPALLVIAAIGAVLYFNKKYKILT